MKKSATWAVATLLAATIGGHGPCLAGETGAAAGPGKILGTLAGSAVPNAQLGREHARGSKTFVFDGSLSDGSLRNNAVIGNSTTGGISTNNSINNNTGITTVFQNSGNNSLFQQTTSIFITVH
jgi:hypothetical protein